MIHKVLITNIILSLLSVLLCSCALNQPMPKPNKLKQYLENATPVDKYRFEVAYEINKNWKFDGNMNSNPTQVTSITFRIMPDGEIKDIFFTKRSRNEALDESAFNAIEKTNPTKPFPHSINKPYIEMGVRFRPNGVK